MEKKKEISDKLIKSLQLENETLKKSLASEKTGNEQLKQELGIVNNTVKELSVSIEATKAEQTVLIKALLVENEGKKRK